MLVKEIDFSAVTPDLCKVGEGLEENLKSKCQCPSNTLKWGQGKQFRGKQRAKYESFGENPSMRLLVWDSGSAVPPPISWQAGKGLSHLTASCDNLVLNT